MTTIDRKFEFVAHNPCTGKVYTQRNGLILCAKDLAVPAALEAYKQKCIELGADENQIASVQSMLERVLEFQKNNPGEVKIPDIVGEEEISRCIKGEGL